MSSVKFSATGVINIFLACVSLLFCISCDDDTHVADTDKVFVTAGTSNILLEFNGTADDKIIPVYVALPASSQSPLKAVVVLHGMLIIESTTYPYGMTDAEYI